MVRAEKFISFLANMGCEKVCAPILISSIVILDKYKLVNTECNFQMISLKVQCLKFRIICLVMYNVIFVTMLTLVFNHLKLKTVV